MPEERTTERTVLELRIHGVANTPPHGMLDLPPGEVEQCDGDGLGSFWVANAEADARDRVPGSAEHPVAPGDLHAVRADVRREAYSWGAMARLGAFPLSGAVGAVGRGLTRALWALNVPFGLANVAYWARRVPGAEDDEVARAPARRSDETVERARPEATAAAVRVFGLALTLLLTAAVTTVTVLVVGTRCMGVVAPDATTVDVCARVPSLLDGLARTDHGDRVVLLSLVPIAVVLLLVAVARAGQVRFDERVSLARAGQVRVGAGTGPLLYRAGFWSRRVAGPSALLAHLAGAVALVAVLLAWTDDRPGTGTALLVAGAVVLALCGVVVALRNDDDGIQVTPPRWKGALAVAALVLAVALWVASAVLSSRRAPGVELPSYVGIDVAPTMLGAALTGIAAAALLWRRRVPTLVWATVPLVVTACLTVVAVARVVDDAGAVAAYGETTNALLVWGAVAALAVPLGVALVPALSPVRRQGPERWSGWSGGGPGVFLLTATATAAVLTSLLVLGTQVYLAGGRDTRPDAEGQLSVAIVRTVPGVQDVPVPSAYTEFGISALVLCVTALLGLLALAAPGLHDLTRPWTTWIGRAAGTESDTTGPTAWAASSIAEAERQRTEGTRQRVADIPVAARRAVRARQVAGVTHRAENAVGVLALASWCTLVVTILLGRAGESVAGVWDLGWDQLAAVAVPAVGALAVALVASFVAAGAEGVSRPWGLLWDLMCFLPRSAHPFGPPCYAERTVPEVAARVEAWLDAEDLPAARRPGVAPRRRVVLSAHSLGAVMAVAVVLGRAGNPAPRTGDVAPALRTDGDGRLGLLTYGVQLRPYFGRFFPSLLGPQVLGTPPCGGPAWRGDPWRRQTTNPRVALRDAALLQAPGARAGSAAGSALAAHDALRRKAVERDAELRQAERRLRSATARRMPEDRVERLRADVAAARKALEAARVPLEVAEDAVTGAVVAGRRALGDDADAAERAYRAARLHGEGATAERRAADAAWSRACAGPGTAPLEPATPTLVRLLRHHERQPAWVNLWRRTDFLGFPVVSYGTNPVDHGADEVDRGAYLLTVAAHSAYPRAWAYHLALDTVLGRLGTPRPGAGTHRATTPPVLGVPAAVG
ncbi:hypothetical protein [Cellulosimicrobium sp. Marseille-Q4280]|uniref:hypothetical protein n=1 Tax=Cellulosimicrobium sp. Marseille-Q4280 TaxID=2937992 RepID=UPI00204238DC|nr:hypothetical protein [Cellulosimicrobium sp. Marseille-Q4280]